MIRHTIGNLLETILDKGQLRRASGLPTQIHMSVIDRCFLPCKHCDIWKNTDKELSTEFWLSVIERMGKWCAPAGMNFVGGEPLMRNDLELLISSAIGWGFETSFNTNGWLVTSKRAQSIVQSGVGLVYISLDGFSKETVDSSRGKEGSFQKALQAIDLLQNAGGTVAIATVLHIKNHHEIPRLVQFAESKGIQLIVQPIYQNFGNVEYNANWWADSEYFPHTEQDKKAMMGGLDWLTEKALTSNVLLNSPKQFQAMKHYFTSPSQDAGISCRAGHSDISIDPQGRVRLCYFLDPVADLHSEQALPDIWNHQQSMRRRWQVSRCTRSCSLLNCNFDAQ